MQNLRGITSAAACLAALPLWIAVAGAQTSTATDASGGDFVTCNGRVGFRTAEQLQSQTDLNGDVDANDSVLQILTLATGTIVNVGVDASGPLACGGNLFAFGANEFSEGLDLNGDGDIFDFVLHVYNAGTLTLTNVGLAVSAVEASSTRIAFAVPEALQGPLGTDLNLDGDTSDTVLHTFDPVGLTATNVGQDASSTIVVAGDRVAFLTSEAAQNATSLNSDLDTLDLVLQVYDAAALTLTSTGRQAEPDFRFDGQVVAFRVSEAAEGDTSLNPEPDASDRVAHVYCLPLAPCAAAGLTNLALAAESVDLGADLVTVAVRERRQGGLDLNGDLDRGDIVLHTRRLSTGLTTNTGKAVYRGVHKISGSYVAFRIPERSQGRADLNGDGDVRDLVVHALDTLTSTTVNTGRSVQRNCLSEPVAVGEGCFGVRGDNVILFTREKDQGFTDLNGDGDFRDRVVELWRLSTATLTSSSTAAHVRGGLALGNTIAAFRRSERQENLDLNGDGDRRDYVITVYDSSTLVVTTLPTSAESLFLVEGDTLVIRTREGVEGVDLNGDADFDDGILQYQPF